jgi:AraC-like DNA-binding protein
MPEVARYREHAVRDPHVAAWWHVEILAEADDWLVLPDGAVDVILVAGGRPQVAGPATRASVLVQRAGSRTVGVRLRPGAAGAALGVAAWELCDLAVPVDALAPAWADGAARAQDALDRGDAAAAGLGLARAIAAAGPRPGAPGRRRPPTGSSAPPAAALAADPGLGASGVARALAISPRHLRRRFADGVGYGPKRYARTMRLQRLLALRARHPGASAGRLAAEAGYADHSHLVRDCRELAGRTPSALLAQRAGVAVG